MQQALAIPREPFRERLRQAALIQRTTAALLPDDWRRRDARREQRMRCRRARLSFPAQRLIERHIEAMARLAIEQRAAGNRAAEHLFEADRLRAELHRVAVVFFRFAALIFHRKRLPAARFTRQRAAGCDAMEFHDIRLPRQAEPRRRQRHAPRRNHVAALFASRLMHPLMQKVAERRQTVLLPRLLDMNQSALARAKEVVLQRRQHKIVIFVIHLRFSLAHPILDPYIGNPLKMRDIIGHHDQPKVERKTRDDKIEITDQQSLFLEPRFIFSKHRCDGVGKIR